MSCDNSQCNRNKLKYQCVACDKLYGSYQGAYGHVKSRVCNDFQNVTKFEVKTPPAKIPEVTKKVNPYNKKFKNSDSKVTAGRKPNIECCPKCKKTFKNRSGLNTHMLYCGGKKYTKCEFCNFRSLHKDVVLKHVKDQHIKIELCKPLNSRVQPQRLQCSNENNTVNICKIKKRKKRKNHSWARGKINKQKTKAVANSIFDCAHCGFESRRKHNLLSHLQCVHKNLWSKNSFICKFCNLNCHNQYRLQSHYNKKRCPVQNDKVVLLNHIKSER